VLQACLAPDSFNIGAKQYMVATFNSDGAFVAEPGIDRRRHHARGQAGDVLIAYGIGSATFATASGANIPPGVIATEASTLTQPLRYRSDRRRRPSTTSAWRGNYVGLYEFFFTGGGSRRDYQINVTLGGVKIRRPCS